MADKTTAKSVIITHSQLSIVQSILNTYLPIHTNVWVFGSRANGKARKFSDLDLLFDNNGKPLSDTLLSNMAEAFDNSALSYKVDLVDWNTLSDAFKKHIQADRIALI